MPVCRYCDAEDGEPQVRSCSTKPFLIGEQFYEPVRWGDEKHWSLDDEKTPCDACLTPRGGVHHPGCCIEECPVCRWPFASCDCLGIPTYEVDPDTPA